MGNKLKRKTKNFILSKLHEAIDLIISFIKENDTISDEQYNTYIEFVNKVIEILLKDELYGEWEFLTSTIGVEDKQDTTNRLKLVKICNHLVKTGINIIENY